MTGPAAKTEMGKVIWDMAKPRDTITPEQWGEICINKIMMVADTAPEPLRSQTYGFRNQIARVIASIVQQAIEADRVARTRELIKDI